ncbi:hypothetical protein [Galactobacter caseinivorans]|uniref:Uncharacterized protein n=1 Tax=Galactobacter caseinivorans TaxID=2676123 RepID=A0A496PIS3_9MICC|nr:hypothetical protein [Galactobacter caseinivorans]RKW70395.1 hypothetical protein DWQ67_07855 [Galactobacter caseinivorans]
MLDLERYVARTGTVDLFVEFLAESVHVAGTQALESASRLEILTQQWHEAAPSRAGSTNKRLIGT